VKFSTIDNGTRDGMLVLVNNDLTRMIRCHGTHGTLREAIEEWDSFLSNVAHLDPDGVASEPFVTEHALAPLPRAWQWLDASAFGCHGELLQKAYDLPPVPSSPPLMYQGMSHQFLAGHHRSRFPSEEHGIDFEAELGVIIGDVPLGCDPDDAMGQIKLIVLINDWSLRTLGAAEMRTGFGWVRAKPACSMAPIAVTPDELGSAWKNGRIHLPVMVDYNGVRFGAACGSAMDYGFHELVAHAAATRELCAGTVIG